ncbi:TIGR03857 family LLM class F420-dependent oxidoreductase [Nocardia carnea]|uniref:TIGR03857 family LLM class F420-dependent oxidoreductase n=1 Tax=Nocardia carnea TaxID=37328 RepID=UPI00245431A7|nr:TIGR03857 family LLM class F420-dependent oxidoreductase [Nocardia carnea]
MNDPGPDAADRDREAPAVAPEDNRSAEFPELGCYGLAGPATDPHALLEEARAAEELSLGTLFLSERFNTKEAFTLAAAAGAVTTGLRICTAATNHNTRHPLVTAAGAVTLHRLTRGRYSLGLGRGFDALFDAIGLPRITSAQIRDAVDIYRRLWRGETVLGHDGPAGRYPLLQLDPAYEENIPVTLTAIGPATLRLAGEIADSVVLHTFFTDETTAHAVHTIRTAAEAVGRDPAAVRIWSVLAVVDESQGESARLRKLAGRLGTYLQGYGEILVRVNGWDQRVLDGFRAHPLVTGAGGALDAVADPETLAAIEELLPAEWLAAAATGTAAHCADRIADQFRAGADGVILHGNTPSELAPVLAAWREHRRNGGAAGRTDPRRSDR